MRTARITAEGTGHYHCMSRAIEGRFIFGRQEKEVFRRIMRKLEIFCGLQILTYSVMSNHWHILVKVPEYTEISDSELIRRIAGLYGQPEADMIRTQLSELRKHGDNYAEILRMQYTYRMNDLSQFMKSLKQSFSQYYNKKSNRCGPLWQQRFKSILVEDSEQALSTMAAYIDLNAVRSGLAEDPKDYRFCGYAEAVAGSKRARCGLALITAGLGIEGSWQDVQGAYRKHLYRRGGSKGVGPDGRVLHPGFRPEQVERIVSSGGELTRSEILHCRVRYFSDGLVLGSKEFVERQFGRYKDQFGLKRTTGARAMKYAQWDGLSTMRELRKAVITVPISG